MDVGVWIEKKKWWEREGLRIATWTTEKPAQHKVTSSISTRLAYFNYFTGCLTPTPQAADGFIPAKSASRPPGVQCHATQQSALLPFLSLPVSVLDPSVFLWALRPVIYQVLCSVWGKGQDTKWNRRSYSFQQTEGRCEFRRNFHHTQACPQACPRHARLCPSHAICGDTLSFPSLISQL